MRDDIVQLGRDALALPVGRQARVGRLLAIEFADALVEAGDRLLALAQRPPSDPGRGDDGRVEARAGVVAERAKRPNGRRRRDRGESS